MKEPNYESSRLPLNEAPSQSPCGAPLDKLVLVVDDNPDVRQLAMILVGHAGAHAVMASDGSEGWDLVGRHRPSLVLTDVEMPRMDGLELCRRIKGSPATQHIPVLVWSGMDHKTAALQAGAADFLPKPVETAHLLRLLEGLLNSKAGR